jgi:probable rRNA maturation factor
MLKVEIDGLNSPAGGSDPPDTGVHWDPKIFKTGGPLKRKFVEEVVRKEFNGDGEVGIVFCDGKTIRRLNRKYRKVDRVTDVLTFPFNDPYSHGFLGEIYICLNRAARQAKEFNHSLEEEVALLIAHGLKSLVNG